MRKSTKVGIAVTIVAIVFLAFFGNHCLRYPNDVKPRIDPVVYDLSKYYSCLSLRHGSVSNLKVIRGSVSGLFVSGSIYGESLGTAQVEISQREFNKQSKEFFEVYISYHWTSSSDSGDYLPMRLFVDVYGIKKDVPVIYHSRIFLGEITPAYERRGLILYNTREFKSIELTSDNKIVITFKRTYQSDGHCLFSCSFIIVALIITIMWVCIRKLNE